MPWAAHVPTFVCDPTLHRAPTMNALNRHILAPGEHDIWRVAAGCELF
jgi:hypothetical protein